MAERPKRQKTKILRHYTLSENRSGITETDRLMKEINNVDLIGG
jgi:hypothetical protein